MKNSSITKISKDFFRFVREDGAVFEIARESAEPNDWIVAFWGAADIEGFATSFHAAIAKCLSAEVPA